MMRQRIRMLALAPVLALLLAGCGDSDVREVRDWMAQVQRETRPAVKPLPQPKDFLPYAYGAREAVDPFNQNKLLGELARAAAVSASPNQPDMTRPRELLETYPLDTMRMVGTMAKAGSATDCCRSTVRCSRSGRASASARISASSRA